MVRDKDFIAKDHEKVKNITAALLLNGFKVYAKSYASVQLVLHESFIDITVYTYNGKTQIKSERLGGYNESVLFVDDNNLATILKFITKEREHAYGAAKELRYI